MSDRGKIKSRANTGTCVQHQHEVAIAIKNAREVALLPYAVRTMAADKGGGRRGRGAPGGGRSGERSGPGRFSGPASAEAGADAGEAGDAADAGDVADAGEAGEIGSDDEFVVASNDSAGGGIDAEGVLNSLSASASAGGENSEG